MATNGIMEGIRGLLSQGKSSTEVINLGYKPSTVYKVQRQLRQWPSEGKAPAQEVNQEELLTDQGEGVIDDFWALFEPVEEPEQSEALREELDQARVRIAELEKETREVQTLRARLKDLQAVAESVGGLRWQARGLESDLECSKQTQAELRQSNAHWQSKMQEETSARKRAEQQAQEYRERISQWQQAYQVLKSQLDASVQEKADLRAEIKQLEPLRAWAGHPCSICSKPMSGVVDRELAGQLIKDLAHKGCLENRGSGLGKLLLAGGMLLGASQLGKR